MAQGPGAGTGSFRSIDAGQRPGRYARGWHCLGMAAGFRDGAPHAIRAFGGKLAVFADSAGELHVLDAYCRHLGGDLSQGTVKGDAVACPFHDWRWNGQGQCVEIPYAKRVPPRARTRAWTTLERNGQLLVWHDPEGNPPIPEQDIPQIPGYGGPEWGDWVWEAIPIDGSNCREIIDNIVDMAHFYYIHYAFPAYFKNVFEGHIATQYLTSRGRPDLAKGSGYAGSESVLVSQASYYGPSYMINYLTSDYRGIPVEAALINCHYPVDANSFVLQYGVMVKKAPGIPGELAQKVASKFSALFKIGFLQDVEIWKNKTPIENPLLCDGDGPVYQLRRWYSQFYVDAADVTPDMTARFEFEVDTTRAVAVWESEVAENMRQAEDAQRAGAAAGPR
jgi:3-ketosteroid 9alpha-monooxygenase subunit A